MDINEVAALRKKWGNKPCSHPHVVSETSHRGKTGDYVCTTCGETGWGKDWVEDERRLHEKDS